MAISTFTAAKTLGSFCGWKLSNLEMNKVLYIAHMIYMGRTNGQRLINDTFEAWEYGPVLPALYKKAKIFGSSPVKDIFYIEHVAPAHTPESAVLREACTNLANAGAGWLVAFTHRPGGAWDKNYIAGARHIQIPDADILSEARGL